MKTGGEFTSAKKRKARIMIKMYPTRIKKQFYSHLISNIRNCLQLRSVHSVSTFSAASERVRCVLI